MKELLKKTKRNVLRCKALRMDKKTVVPVVCLLAFTVMMAMVFSPGVAGACFATLGLMAFVDEETLDDEKKKFFQGLDNALGESCRKFISDEIDKKEFAKNLDEIRESIKTLSDDKLKQKVGTKQFEEFKDSVIKEIAKVKAATEKGSDGSIKFKSLEEQVTEQLKDYISTNEKGFPVIDLKAACKNGPGRKTKLDLFVKDYDLSTPPPILSVDAPHLGGVVIDNSISRPLRGESELRRIANVSPISARTLIMAELYDVKGDAEWVPEGGLKPNMHAKIKESNVNAGKVALTTKLTEETLRDLPQVVAEIRAEIINRIDIAEEQGIFHGTGQDGEINGVFNNIPGFSLTGLSVQKPNYFDALMAAYTQIVSVSELGLRPNAALLDPIDIATMNLQKDSSGNYLFPPFTLNEKEIIPGFRIIPSNAVEQGRFIIGDFRYLNIRDHIGLTIEFGWENDDFTRNQVTMIGEKYLMAYIKSNYLIAFVEDSFDNVMEAIAAPEETPGNTEQI